MINPSFKELSNISKSRYDISMIISKRAEQLVEGDKPLIKDPQGKQAVTVALEELMKGKVWKINDNEK